MSRNTDAILAQPVNADSGSCLMFEYSPDWSKMPLDDTWGPKYDPLYDSVNVEWIKPDSEYIVFLRLVNVGVTTTSNLFTIYPTMQGLGTSACMYPINNGIVQNANNDFGFGANASVADFIAAIRQRIGVLTKL
jgi:hypothetical protein